MDDGIGGVEDVKLEQIDETNERDTEMVDKELIVSLNAASELVSKDASQSLGGNASETEIPGENARIPPLDNCEVTPPSPRDVGLESMEKDVNGDPADVGLETLEKYVNGDPVVIGLQTMENDVNGNTGDVGLETVVKDANGDPGEVELINKKKRKGKVVSKVASSWSLRSRVQEKPKTPPEPTEAVEEGSGSGESSRRRRRKKKRAQKVNTNEFLRTRNQLSYLLGRIKYEQSLIDAYSAEGWKGLSSDKLKPEKELQRAKSHIVRYKLRIRELFQQLDSLLEVGKLPESLFDDQGEIDSEDIFCAKCGSKDLPLDNDIILCDGACERGFHQFCLEPPLLNEDIPPGDEDWFCPGCDCKDDCIDVLNEFQGTNISILDKWEKIFPEATEAATGDKPDDGSSSDGEDDDYDPNKPDVTEKVERVSSSDDSGYFSAPDELAAPNNDDYIGLPSEDSEDDDFDPEDADSDKQVKQSSSSSDFTSDSEDLGALLDDDAVPGDDTEIVSPPSELKQKHSICEEEDLKVGRRKRPSLKDELCHLMENSNEPVSGRRHVERLDYKRLYDEEYGNTSSDSSDEDFNDTKAPKRRKVNHPKTEAITPKKPQITEKEVEDLDEHNKESPQLPKRTRKSNASGGVSPTSDTLGSSSGSSKRSRKSNVNDGVGATSDTSGGSKRSAKRRLGDAVSERLCESFSNNKYPERAVKEQLANELGLTIQQVSKWFGNARWSLNHRQQMESCKASKPSDPQPATDTENISSSKAVEMHGSDTNATEKNIAEKTMENAEN